MILLAPLRPTFNLFVTFWSIAIFQSYWKVIHNPFGRVLPHKKRDFIRKSANYPLNSYLIHKVISRPALSPVKRFFRYLTSFLRKKFIGSYLKTKAYIKSVSFFHENIRL